MHTAGFKDIYTLIRFPVSLAVTLSSLTGMVMATGEINSRMIWPLLAIFLLASGASAFNQYQEWPRDEKMDRTRSRPIPSRRISPAEGLRIAMIALVGGLIILMYQVNWNTLVLGLINLFWYNGLYTWLKRKTAFAVFPGALTGVIPVMMGFASMEHDYLSPTALFLSFFIFIWQMPHFWLLMLKYGDDYRKAGFPVLNDIFSESRSRIIVMVWVIASTAVPIMLVFFRIIHHPLIGYTIMALNIILLLILAWQLFLASSLRYRLVFVSANLFLFLVLAALTADSLLP
ncbi:MAG: protoheme IX farnesyltransferase [Bacteroidales bacterium]|nr:protoheme IX farnesyltransferase [Bacteroidales bacterium]